MDSSDFESNLPPGELGRLFTQQDAFMESLGVELIDIGEGTARVSMCVQPQHLNFNQTCHGGVIFSLADCAFGVSSNSHGVVAAGINAHISYQAPAHLGETLIATSTEKSRSRKLATYNIEVSGENEKCIASFTGTVYILDKTHAVGKKTS